MTDALERVGQALRVLARDAATAHGLSPIQLQLMLRLAAEPPARRQVGALADRFDVSQPTVSDAVAALRRKGLVDRHPGPAGRRGRRLDLTEAGRALLPQLADWDAPVRVGVARLAAADKAVMLAALLGLIVDLQWAGVITVARMCVTCRFFQPRAHPGTAAEHHCALLDLPLAAHALRVDCPEHQPAASFPARVGGVRRVRPGPGSRRRQVGTVLAGERGSACVAHVRPVLAR